MRPSKVRRRYDNVTSEINMEDMFAGLKTKMDFLDQFMQAFSDELDPAIQQQIQLIKRDVRNDVMRLVKGGISLADMFAKFGAILFKSQVLKAKDFLSKANKDVELVDLINEDQVLEDRLNMMNDIGRKEDELERRRKKYGPIYLQNDGVPIGNDGNGGFRLHRRPRYGLSSGDDDDDDGENRHARTPINIRDPDLFNFESQGGNLTAQNPPSRHHSYASVGYQARSNLRLDPIQGNRSLLAQIIDGRSGRPLSVRSSAMQSIQAQPIPQPQLSLLERRGKQPLHITDTNVQYPPEAIGTRMTQIEQTQGHRVFDNLQRRYKQGSQYFFHSDPYPPPRQINHRLAAVKPFSLEQHRQRNRELLERMKIAEQQLKPDDEGFVTPTGQLGQQSPIEEEKGDPINESLMSLVANIDPEIRQVDPAVLMQQERDYNELNQIVLGITPGVTDSNTIQQFKNASELVGRIGDHGLLEDFMNMVQSHISNLTQIDGVVVPISIRDQAMAQIMPEKLRFNQQNSSQSVSQNANDLTSMLEKYTNIVRQNSAPIPNPDQSMRDDKPVIKSIKKSAIKSSSKSGIKVRHSQPHTPPLSQHTQFFYHAGDQTTLRKQESQITSNTMQNVSVQPSIQVQRQPSQVISQGSIQLQQVVAQPQVPAPQPQLQPRREEEKKDRSRSATRAQVLTTVPTNQSQANQYWLGQAEQAMQSGDILNACIYLRDGSLNFASKDEPGVLKPKFDVTTKGFKEIIDPLLTSLGNYRDNQLNGYIQEINTQLPALKKSMTSSKKIADVLSKIISRLQGQS